jgi:hypothetical protein
MKLFTIYDSVTGDVIGTGAVTDDSDLPLQARPGVAVMPDVRLDRETQKVDTAASRPQIIFKTNPNDPNQKPKLGG